MRAIALSVALSALGACAVGPDYEMPELAAPAAWSTSSDGAADLARWWMAFDDRTLDGLIDEAVASNLDLKVAGARVREARARLGSAAGALLPSSGAGADYRRGRPTETGAIPADGSAEDFYSAGFDASWELDLFGGRRRSVEAARADHQAAIEDERAVLVTLLGEVARAYVELRGYRRLAAVQRRNVSAARGTLELTQTRFKAGLGTALDVSRAEAQVAGTEALVPESERAARAALHRLGVLLGREPGALAARLQDDKAIPSPPSRIGAGLPSDLLRRRPDVRRAERSLAAATARVGVATAELYPKFSIVGGLGLESISLTDFVKPSSRAWSIGPSVRWSIFEGGRIRADIEAADAQMEQARLAFEKAFLLALEEVENALVGYASEWRRRRSLEEAVRASAKSAELATDLYRKGLASFLDVLAAESSLYEAQQSLARSEAAVSLQAVALYKGLGGGWE